MQNSDKSDNNNETFPIGSADLSPHPCHSRGNVFLQCCLETEVPDLQAKRDLGG